MEVKYLIYKGNRESGTLIVKQMPANSPFRALNYTAGMKKEIGIDIPAKVADMIVGSYKTLFGYETIVLDDKDSLLREFSQMIQRYIMLDPVEIHEIVVGVIEKAFGLDADVPAEVHAEQADATVADPLPVIEPKPAKAVGRVRRK